MIAEYYFKRLIEIYPSGVVSLVPIHCLWDTIDKIAPAERGNLKPKTKVMV